MSREIYDVFRKATTDKAGAGMVHIRVDQLKSLLDLAERGLSQSAPKSEPETMVQAPAESLSEPDPKPRKSRPVKPKETPASDPKPVEPTAETV